MYIVDWMKIASSNDLYKIFISIMVIIFALACFKKNIWFIPFPISKLKSKSEEMLVSLAMAGCVFEIIMAVLHFKTTNPVDSLGEFFKNIKYGFITSCCGLSLKWLLSLIFLFQKDNSITPVNPETSLSDTLNILKNQQIEQNTHFRQMLEMMEQQNKNSDKNLNTINETLMKFAEQLSESAGKQLIEALKAVITDFNKNLVEQFGDNFKLLNNACLELVKWQAEFRDTMTDLSRINKESTFTLKEQASTMQELVECMKQFGELANNLGELINNLDKNYDSMKTAQESLATSLESLKGAGTFAIENINKMTESLDLGAKNLADSIQSNQQNVTNQISHTMSELHHHMNNQMINVGKQMEMIVNKLDSNLTTIIESTSNASHENINKMTESLDLCTKNLADSIKSNQDNITKQLSSSIAEFDKYIKKLDAEIENQLNTTIKKLGQNISDIIETLALTREDLVKRLKHPEQRF